MLQLPEGRSSAGPPWWRQQLCLGAGGFISKREREQTALKLGKVWHELVFLLISVVCIPTVQCGWMERMRGAGKGREKTKEGGRDNWLLFLPSWEAQMAHVWKEFPWKTLHPGSDWSCGDSCSRTGARSPCAVTGLMCC